MVYARDSMSSFLDRAASSCRSEVARIVFLECAAWLTSVQLTSNARIAKRSSKSIHGLILGDGLKSVHVAIPVAPQGPEIEVDEVDTAQIAASSQHEMFRFDVTMKHAERVDVLHSRKLWSQAV